VICVLLSQYNTVVSLFGRVHLLALEQRLLDHASCWALSLVAESQIAE
jgi:hypothetical protein